MFVGAGAEMPFECEKRILDQVGLLSDLAGSSYIFRKRQNMPSSKQRIMYAVKLTKGPESRPWVGKLRPGGWIRPNCLLNPARRQSGNQCVFTRVECVLLFKMHLWVICGA
ncbi:Hypothetical predicted protein [Podarcis lilfordi]|uniref:Uncharacterized protein n=1 Tax=Podarcis lilfordi TaxID=74358 RepID=A0AA35PUQ6_9SAUR|nr:Hypothetical predicted protein [Podarcis lilfordi]